MKFEDLGFRDVYHIPHIVSYRIENVGFNETETPVPDYANAILAYPYVDSMCGLNLSVVAPAVLPSRQILDEYGLFTQFRCLLTLRPGVYEDLDWEPVDDVSDVRDRFADHFEAIDSGYGCGEPVEATRKIELIDHLRHPSYPDDVQVALFSDSGSFEIVWMRLNQITDEGYLCAELLNQPYGDYKAMAGDIMVLDLTKDSDEVFRLFTRDAMIFDAQGRKRIEEFKRRKGEDEASEEV